MKPNFKTYPACLSATVEKLKLRMINNANGKPFDGSIENLPFSFHYAGLPFEAWIYTGQEDCSDVRFVDPTGIIQVRLRYSTFAEFGAVAWYLEFTNISQEISEVINDVNVVKVGLIDDLGRSDSFVLHSSFGALGDNPATDGYDAGLSDFTPWMQSFAKTQQVLIKSSQGRSSSGSIPYFTVQEPGGNGTIFAIGWTGQWRARFAVDETGTNFGIEAGQEAFFAQLLPEETIRTPAVLLMPWTEGDRETAQNQFRRLMLAKFSPKLHDGQVLEPRASASVYFSSKTREKLNEKEVLAATEGVVKSGLALNTLWMDAGWYPVARPGSPQYEYLSRFHDDNLWLSGVGDWEFDSARFPQGFSAVSGAAHRAGMKTLLWFEPERVSPPALFFEQFKTKNWLLQTPKQATDEGELFNLVNFSDSAVTKALEDLIVSRLTTEGVDIFRHDMNINQILAYWQQNDLNQSRAMNNIARTGMTEAAYIAGLYHFWDSLRERLPGLLIDSTAAGGRRLDFEALSRTVCLWRSDRFLEPLQQQEQTLGLSAWIPLHGNGVPYFVPNLRYALRSNFGWSSVYSFLWAELKFSELQLIKPEINAMFGKSSPLGRDFPLAKSFLGDFYPLTDPATKPSPVGNSQGPRFIPRFAADASAWVGWQFHRQDLKAGLIQTFRRSATAPQENLIKLRGLELTGQYKLWDLDVPGSAKVYTGQQLRKAGILLQCEPAPCAKIMAYRIL